MSRYSVVVLPEAIIHNGIPYHAAEFDAQLLAKTVMEHHNPIIQNFFWDVYKTGKNTRAYVIGNDGLSEMEYVGMQLWNAGFRLIHKGPTEDRKAAEFTDVVSMDLVPMSTKKMFDAYINGNKDAFVVAYVKRVARGAKRKAEMLIDDDEDEVGELVAYSTKERKTSARMSCKPAPMMPVLRTPVTSPVILTVGAGAASAKRQGLMTGTMRRAITKKAKKQEQPKKGNTKEAEKEDGYIEIDDDGEFSFEHMDALMKAGVLTQAEEKGDE